MILLDGAPYVPPADDKAEPPKRRGRWWNGQVYNRGRGPGATATGVKSSPPEKRPPPGNVVLL